MESTTPLPSGTVTFLFTDIEGSTRLWERHPGAMEAALGRHDALAAAVIPQHAGTLVKQRGEGDSLFAVFARPADAVAAATALQQALYSEPWQPETPVRVRMALHTGNAALREGDYYGTAVNRCARLRALAHGGQVLLSQTTGDLVREHLPTAASLRDLGSHRLKDLQQPERIFELLHPDLPADFPPLRSLAAFAHNLPAQLTSFIGREAEMAEVKQFLATTRLLTLSGSGGCGKTRLALQVAADLLEEYPDGVWLVELAPLADPTLVPQTVASALGVREEPGRPLTATLGDYLRPKQVLLVLDNCEHLLAACAQLAESLLRACLKLRILASSREGLGIGGEQTYRVPSLSLPDTRHLPPLEGLQEFEAVQLFADRARLSQATFAVTQVNAPAVVQVCERLDGIPLAIELAAARVKALPVEKLNERLDNMFRLLTGGSRTALPRQQTLRALIDWSYDLLSEPERALMRRLSAFAAGWTLEAAEAVCVGEGVEEWEVLDLLTSLVEKSLVLYEEREGEGRYRLLETVRQYARDRLLEAGEAAGVRGRHRDWCLELAERAEPHLCAGAEQAAWLNRLEREHDNLRASLAWCQEVEESAEAGLRLAGALNRFWYKRGRLAEGMQWLTSALAAGSRASVAVRGKALGGAMFIANTDQSASLAALSAEGLTLGREAGDKWLTGHSLLGMGWAANNRGDHTEAAALFEEGLPLAREAGDPWLITILLQNLAIAAQFRGDVELARALHQEALHRYRKAEDTGGTAAQHLNLGGLAWGQGDYDQSRALFSEALALLRENDDRIMILDVLGTLAYLALEQRDYETARGRWDEALAIARELDDKSRMADLHLSLARLAQTLSDDEAATAHYAAARVLFEEDVATNRERGDQYKVAASLNNLGHVFREQGEYEAARAHYQASLAIRGGLGYKPGILRNLTGLVVVALAQAQFERAARFFGVVEELREATGVPLPPADRAEHERSVAAVRTALGEEAFAAAWAEGRAMSLEEAIKYALED
jgi:predicted ATPase/class 3 adenylate cyclase/Tfp pilus assembly protein PilF